MTKCLIHGSHICEAPECGPAPVRKTLSGTNWGITLMLDGKPYAAFQYPIGPQGPVDSPDVVRAAEAWRDDPTDFAFLRAVEQLKYLTVIQWHSSDGRVLGHSEYYPPEGR